MILLRYRTARNENEHSPRYRISPHSGAELHTPRVQQSPSHLHEVHPKVDTDDIGRGRRRGSQQKTSEATGGQEHRSQAPSHLKSSAGAKEASFLPVCINTASAESMQARDV